MKERRVPHRVASESSLADFMNDLHRDGWAMDRPTTIIVQEGVYVVSQEEPEDAQAPAPEPMRLEEGTYTVSHDKPEPPKAPTSRAPKPEEKK